MKSKHGFILTTRISIIFIYPYVFLMDKHAQIEERYICIQIHIDNQGRKPGCVIKMSERKTRRAWGAEVTVKFSCGHEQKMTCTSIAQAYGNDVCKRNAKEPVEVKGEVCAECLRADEAKRCYEHLGVKLKGKKEGMFWYDGLTETKAHIYAELDITEKQREELDHLGAIRTFDGAEMVHILVREGELSLAGAIASLGYDLDETLMRDAKAWIAEGDDAEEDE